MSTAPLLVLTNARILGDEGWRLARIRIAGEHIERIEAAGEEGGERGALVVDCQGATVLPGFIDAHMHLLGYAATLAGVECTPQKVASIEALKSRLRARAERIPSGAWIRGWGYDEFTLGRHPTRLDLDAVVPNHPVKLLHRSGHACVLNSVAMQRLGISGETPEPSGATIERGADGEPNGVLLEMEEELESRGLPTLTGADLREAVNDAFEMLLSYGVTSVHEATPPRALATWEMLQELATRERLPIRVFKMVGVGDLPELKRRGLAYQAGSDTLRVGLVKVMLSESGGALHPGAQELRGVVERAGLAGFPVAFHGVEERTIAAALDAIKEVEPPAGARHRIEHCGVSSPELVRRLVAARVAVVTQPGFIYESGERYLATVPEGEREWLYRVGTLLEAGVPVAFGSDAPVVAPDPLLGVRAAVTRESRGGRTVGLRERVSAEQALAAYSQAGARLAGEGQSKGWIVPGMLADLVVLNGAIESLDVSELGSLHVAKTVVGGKVGYER